jgi:hypothetical protein
VIPNQEAAMTSKTKKKAKSAQDESLLDTFMIEGKPIGEYTFAEAKAVGKALIRDGRLALLYARFEKGQTK